MSDYVRNGIATTGAAIKIASALDRSIDWLLTGAGSPTAVVDALDADFVGLPRYDMHTLSEEAGKGQRVETIPIRRDWLNRRVGTSRGLWVTEMPSSYPDLALYEDDAVICSDIARAAPPPDNTVCFFLGTGLFVARYRDRWLPDAADVAGPRLGPADLAHGDVTPIARIRSRLLSNL